MKDFRIILDKTIHFSNKEQLFVMIISESGQLYLEVNDRGSLIYKRRLNAKTNIDCVHAFVYRKLSLIKDFQSCRALVQFAFGQSLIKEALFIIDLVSRKEITWNKILQLQEQHNFNIDFEFDNTETETRHKLKVVHVKFDGGQKHIGKFIKQKTSEEFQFIANLK